MQKKKNSVMMISALVIILGGLAVANSTNIRDDIEAVFNKKPDAPITPGQKSSDNDKDIIKQELAKNAVSKKPQKKMGMIDEDAPAPDVIPDTPTILIPKPVNIKPIDNDTAVSSGWYSKESNIKNKEEQIQKKREATGG